MRIGDLDLPSTHAMHTPAIVRCVCVGLTRCPCAPAYRAARSDNGYSVRLPSADISNGIYAARISSST
jgi:hypothetical protein